MPLTGRKSGELVTVDKGWFGEVLERYAEAVGAVERGNNRAGGVKLERRCTAALFASGSVPPGCALIIPESTKLRSRRLPPAWQPRGLQPETRATDGLGPSRR